MERQESHSGASDVKSHVPVTIGEACVQASLFLESHGIGEARANAERLMQHLLGVERSGLLRDWRDPLPEELAASWERLVARKAAGEPVQYIVGEQWFYGLQFAVTPDVLIPRPETELLVEAVLETADRLWPESADSTMSEVAAHISSRSSDQDKVQAKNKRPVVLDVGTGSGTIGVTLAVQRPNWQVYASDLSASALTVARANAERHGAAARMSFVEGDLLVPFKKRINKKDANVSIDILVSNPPYIPAGDIPDLQPEVRDYEPRLALDGGTDGLNPYRLIVQQLSTLEAIPRIVAFELGQGQAEAVAELLRNCGFWREIRIIPDYAGIDRHVMAID